MKPTQQKVKKKTTFLGKYQFIKSTCSFRVRTPEQVGLWRGGAPLVGQRMTTVGMNMKEVRVFFRMEAAHEVTMKIRGATMGTAFISLLSVELFLPLGG